MLPKDPYILLSVVNARLRDQYTDLADLCASLDEDEDALRQMLAGLTIITIRSIISLSKPVGKEVF